MNSRPVTIVDVARLAGVSHSTVSRVLNGHRHVRSDTRDRVETAAAELGYVANLHARGLAGGATQAIGLVTLEVSSSYIVEVTRGVDEELAVADMDLMLSTTREEHERERDHVLRMSHGSCDGLIVLIPSAADMYLEALAKRSYPIVLIDHGPTPLASTLTMDNRAGAEGAVTHLVELGHRRIGHVTGAMSTEAARQRLDGWHGVLEAHGLDHGDDLVAEGDFRRESGKAAAAELLDLDDPPTAILAASDLTAIGVLDELRERGLQCPQDMSVVGFDDVPEATLTTPTLTTIRQPMRALGHQAVRLLLNRIERPDDPVVHLVMATELVVRETCAPPRR